MPDDPNWIERQLEASVREVATWPKWMQPKGFSRTMNDALNTHDVERKYYHLVAKVDLSNGEAGRYERLVHVYVKHYPALGYYEVTGPNGKPCRLPTLDNAIGCANNEVRRLEEAGWFRLGGNR